MLSVADVTSVIDERQVKSERCEMIKAKDDRSTGRRTCPKSVFHHKSHIDWRRIELGPSQ